MGSIENSKCTKFSKWEGGLYHSRFLFHEQYQNEFLRNKTHILVSLLGTLGEIWTRETYSELLRVCQKKKTENSAKVYPTKRGVFLLLNFVMNCKREEKWKSSKKKKKFPAKKKLCDLIFIGASQKLNFLKTNFIFLCRLWLRETWMWIMSDHVHIFHKSNLDDPGERFLRHHRLLLLLLLRAHISSVLRVLFHDYDMRFPFSLFSFHFVFPFHL